MLPLLLGGEEVEDKLLLVVTALVPNKLSFPLLESDFWSKP